MTVKKLAPWEQRVCVALFREGHSSINDLATKYSVHRKTMIRVLEEQGVDPGIKKRAKKVKLLPMPSPTDLSGYPYQPKPLPWIYRVAQKVRSFFAG